MLVTGLVAMIAIAAQPFAPTLSFGPAKHASVVLHGRQVQCYTVEVRNSGLLPVWYAYYTHRTDGTDTVGPLMWYGEYKNRPKASANITNTYRNWMRLDRGESFDAQVHPDQESQSYCMILFCSDWRGRVVACESPAFALPAND